MKWMSFVGDLLDITAETTKKQIWWDMPIKKGQHKIQRTQKGNLKNTLSLSLQAKKQNVNFGYSLMLSNGTRAITSHCFCVIGTSGIPAMK